MSASNVSLSGLNFIRGQEGRALRAYQDSVGVWTIGYGITNYDKDIGFKVGPGVTITADQAEQLLYTSLRRNYLPRVERALDFAKCPKAQGALDGGLSFDYNTGGIAKASWPKALMHGDLSSAEQSLKSWNRAGGNVLSGLTRRRAEEWLIIRDENYGHLTGPEEENDRGRRIGQGELLTALPGGVSPELQTGHVTTTGIPSPGPVAAPGVLTIGTKGARVEQLQRNLQELGYPAPVSGEFDEATAAQVQAFQRTHPQITADGKVGPATEAAIQRSIDLRRKLGKVIKTGVPTIPIAAAPVWQWVSTHGAQLTLAAGAVIVVAALALVAWQYRQEIHALVNKASGRSVI